MTEIQQINQSNIAEQNSNKFIKFIEEQTSEFNRSSIQQKMSKVAIVSAVASMALPVFVIAAPLAIIGAIVGLVSFLVIKGAILAGKGAKWSADKTVEGVKSLGKEIKSGAEYSANKIKDGYEFSKNGIQNSYKSSKESLKRVTSRASDRVGDFFKEAAHSNDYGIRFGLVQNSLERGGVQNEINELCEILQNDKNSTVLKEIKQAMKSSLQNFYLDALPGNDAQKATRSMIDVSDRLENILSSRVTNSKNIEVLISAVSYCKGDINRILNDYKENPEKYRKESKLSFKATAKSISAFMSLSARNETEENSDTYSVSSGTTTPKSVDSTTSSTAELLDTTKRKSAEQPSSFKQKVSSWLSRSKKEQKIEDLWINNTATFEYEQLSSQADNPLRNPNKSLPDSEYSSNRTSSTELGADTNSLSSVNSNESYATIKHENLRRSNSASSIKSKPIVPPKPPRTYADAVKGEVASQKTPLNRSSSNSSGYDSGQSSPSDSSGKQFTASTNEIAKVRKNFKSPSTKVNGVDTNIYSQPQAAITA
ncbi:actin-bundling T4SS effector WalE1 family protein [Wolbachia endosymbiont of Pentidionis agamae]|uniref:actin-bundling T4SS effector WalE1 family protein n=1 Tax=Wolbachia endosymbiont of Pentidionis agamae TaxID=3110435 RepID=UPI002FD12695